LIIRGVVHFYTTSVSTANRDGIVVMLQSDTAVISIAQRTLIPKNITGALSVLTIPEEDIGSVSDIRHLAPQLFGVPREATLDKNEHLRVADLIRRTELWEAIINDYSLLSAPSQ
jgi:hypothetical protein